MLPRLPGYSVLDALETASQSTILMAERESDKFRVIVKLLKSEAPTAGEIAQLKREYRLTQLCSGPYTIQAIEFLSLGSTAAICFEDFGALSLDQFLDQGKIDLDKALRIAECVVEGFKDIHKRDVIHKDINPRNIVYSESGKLAKIIDFGVSTQFESGKHSVVTQALEGSYLYISPEQTGRMNREIDYRTDYYSFGATLYHMVTGQPPFEAPDAIGYVHAHIAKTARHPSSLSSDVPRAIGDIIMKLMAKNAEDRYQSPQGLLHDLRTCREAFSQNREIENFVPGTRDWSDRFNIPSRLFGRDDDIRYGMELYRKVRSGESCFLSVSGPLGIGKTALVGEWEKYITMEGGFFISGHFEEARQNIPYSGLAKAINDSVGKLLLRPGSEIEKLKAQMLKALKNNGQVATQLSSELEDFLGPQPALDSLDAESSEYRTINTLNDYLRCLVSSDKPLILFLDDAQWADPQTLQVLQSLKESTENKHLMVILAYRAEERSNATVAALLDRLGSDAGASIFRVQPLSEQNILEILQETLRCPSDRLVEPSQEIFKKTHGNPFFLHDILRRMTDSKVFTLHHDSGEWDWDIQAMRAFRATGNVLDVMLEKLAYVDDKLLALLRIAASLGLDFSLKNLAMVSGSSALEVARLLQQAVKADLVFDRTGNLNLMDFEGENHDDDFNIICQFAHEKLVEAILSPLDVNALSAINIQIGRRMLEVEGADEFKVAYYFLHAVDRIEAKERLPIAQLWLKVARRSLENSGQEAGYAFSQAVYGLVEDSWWESHYTLTREIFETFARAVYGVGRFEESLKITNQLLNKAKTNRERAEILLLQLNHYSTTARINDRLKTLIRALGFVGVKLEEHPEPMRVLKELLWTRLHTSGGGLAKLLQKPDMKDPEKILIMRLLGEAGVVAYTLRNFVLYAQIVGMRINLSFRFGISEHTPYSLFSMAMILQNLGLRNSALQAHDTGMKLIERVNTDLALAPALCVAGSLIHHWYFDQREVRAILTRSVEAAYRSSSYKYLALAHLFGSFLDPTLNLDEVTAYQAEIVRTIEDCHWPELLIQAAVISNFWRALKGETRGRGSLSTEEHDEYQIIDQYRRERQEGALANIFGLQSLVAVLFRDFDRAANAVRDFNKYKSGSSTTIMLRIAWVSSFLTDAARYHQLEKVAKRVAWRNMQWLEREYAGWAKLNPKNFQHTHLLMQAELNRLQKKWQEASKLYEAAVQAARDFSGLDYAIYLELQGRFWLETGNSKVAAVYLAETRNAFAIYGADEKVKQLDEDFAELFGQAPAAATARDKLRNVSQLSIHQTAQHASRQLTRQSVTATVGRTAMGNLQTSMEDSLDMDTVLKTSRALSSEVKLDKLLASLMQALIENSGAQGGRLVLHDQRQKTWTVKISYDDGHVNPKAECLEDYTEIPQSLLQYVLRSKKSVILAAASTDKTYGRDPYFVERGVRSVLASPIVHQGGVIGAIYLENNLSSGAFTNDRMELVELLTAQAAVSIENAELYRNLEDQINERTRAIRSILKNIKQGIFMIAPGRQIHEEYSTHLEEMFEAVVPKAATVDKYFLQACDLNQDQKDMIKFSMDSILGEEEYNWEANSHHLIKQCEITAANQKKMLEIDWNPIINDEGLVEKILVAARDVTEIKKLEILARKNQDELNRVSQILKMGDKNFLAFIANAKLFMGSNLETLQSSADLGHESDRELYIRLHTLKGVARSYKFLELSNAIHETEQILSDSHVAVRKENLLAAHRNIMNMVDEIELTWRVKLGRGQAAEAVQAGRGILLGIIEKYDDASILEDAEAREHLSEIRAEIRRFYYASIPQAFDELVQNLPALAKDLGRAPPLWQLEAPDLALTDEGVELIRNTFVHLFRNSLDHGIETPEVRLANGKPAAGLLQLKITEGDGKVYLSFQDDGRGLDLRAILQKAREKGLVTQDADLRPEEIAGLIFHEGLSTTEHVTDISGRGIGMDAVRKFFQGVEGDIRIDLLSSASEVGSGLPFRFQMVLPDRLFRRYVEGKTIASNPSLQATA